MLPAPRCALCADPDVLLIADAQPYCALCWTSARPRDPEPLPAALRAPAKPPGITISHGSLTPEREAAYERERLDGERRAINRAMVEAAREREAYVARPQSSVASRQSPEQEAHHQLRALLAGQTAPELAALRTSALAWLAEDQAGVRRSALGDRTDDLTPNAQRLAPRRRRIPLGYVAECPWRITLARARMLDLRLLGASTAQIAAIETVSVHTVRAALKHLVCLLAAPSLAAALATWRTWCTQTGRTPEPALVHALSLVRGRPALSPVAARLSPDQAALWAQIAQGATYAAIAAEWGLGPEAIKSRAAGLYRALGVRRRAEAVAAYWASQQEPEPEVPHAG